MGNVKRTVNIPRYQWQLETCPSREDASGLDKGDTSDAYKEKVRRLEIELEMVKNLRIVDDTNHIKQLKRTAQEAAYYKGKEVGKKTSDQEYLKNLDDLKETITRLEL